MYCGYAQRSNYGKKTLNHYFRDGTHCERHIYTVLQLIEIAVRFAHLSFFDIDTTVRRAGLTMTNSLDHYFPHGARCVYHIYRVLKLFEMAVCFPHFSFFEIDTTVKRALLTMATRL